MLGPNAVHLQALCQLVEAAVQVVAELHEVLDIVHCREVDLRRGAAGVIVQKVTILRRHVIAALHICNMHVRAGQRRPSLTFNNSKKSASDCGSGWQVSTLSRYPKS